MYFGCFLFTSLKEDMLWKQNNPKSQNWQFIKNNVFACHVSTHREKLKMALILLLVNFERLNKNLSPCLWYAEIPKCQKFLNTPPPPFYRFHTYIYSIHIFKGRFLKMSFFSYSEPKISTTVTLIYTKLNSLIHIYILRALTEGFVHVSFIAWFM